MLFKVNYLYLILILICISIKICATSQVDDDNDFAEFEDEENTNSKSKSHKKVSEDIVENLNEEPEAVSEENAAKESIADIPFDDDDEAIVEEEDEFSHFEDEDEFVGYEENRLPKTNAKPGRFHEEPKITIAKVPLHLRSNWDSFYLELLMIAGLAVYFANFFIGKGKNQKIASLWFEKHKTLLESNFSLVGDDGKAEIETHGLVKESENVYILWCSGRTLMEGMLIELRLLKRQDLIGVISQIIRPSTDQLIVNVHLEDMDSFVFAFGHKKTVAKLAKDMADINTYCPEKRSLEKYGGAGSQFVVHSEIGEISSIILRDPKVETIISKFPDFIDFFHFSDQYSGPKQQEDTQAVKLPPVKKMLVFGFNFPTENITENGMENMKPLMQLILYLTDKIHKLKLSKESKLKADKNRAKIEDAFLKATHTARAELAQNVREEKRRKERERIMSLDDPEKQRKWEEREQKKQQKRKTPKIKTMKIRPM